MSDLDRFGVNILDFEKSDCKVKDNYYALFLSIVKEYSVAESILEMGLPQADTKDQRTVKDLSDSEWLEIKEKARNGESISDLAKEHNISYNSIQQKTYKDRQLARKKKKKVREHIGKFVKFARNEKGYTQKQLSEMTGISPGHIGVIECTPERGVSTDAIKKIAEAFGISFEQISDMKWREEYMSGGG